MRKNKTMKLLALAIAVVMLTAAFVGCDLFGKDPQVTVSISQQTAEIAVGSTCSLLQRCPTAPTWSGRPAIRLL